MIATIGDSDQDPATAFQAARVPLHQPALREEPTTSGVEEVTHMIYMRCLDESRMIVPCSDFPPFKMGWLER